MAAKEKAGRVVVVGGGLVGSLAAAMLAARGFDVVVYERGPDLRQVDAEAGRSINLVVTARGLAALDRIGLRRGTLDLTVAVTGRMIHSVRGDLSYQPYGKDPSECNHSISRKGLNEFLVTEAERRGARFRFHAPLVGADLERGLLRFDGHDDVRAGTILGADGAASVVRSELMNRPGAAERVELLDHGYKELLIPADLGRRIEKHALHVWPRGNIMLMALPNLDGSFTLTLYLPHAGPGGFESLDTEAKVRGLFERQFPDAIPLIPDLVEAFFRNPTGELGTVRCRPWHLGGRAGLIGDAAHAIVPFFGQGMNCGFEDCAVLDDLLEAHGADWGSVLPALDRLRKPNTDAIADMALENFVEMRDRVGDPRFQLRKQVEHRLEQTMPSEYRSRYSMVMYSGIPYLVALEAGRLQQEILDELCAGLQRAKEVDLERARALIRRKLGPYLKRQSVDLDY